MGMWKSKLTLLVALALMIQTIPAGALQKDPNSKPAFKDSGSEFQKSPKSPAKVKTLPPPKPSPEWDPKDPAALQYADGAWAIAYNDAAWPVPNLFFRRSLGGGDPQYWKDATQVESAARSSALIRLGSTTALFYIKAAPTVMQVFVKTSTDDGTTWSSGVQLSSGTSNASQVQVSNVGGTIYMFWSQEGSSGLVQYLTSTDLSSWSGAISVGQTVANYFPVFDIKKLASGDWGMTWLGPSPTQWPSNNNDFSVVWFARSSSLTSTTWSNKQELSSPWAGTLNERFPGSVSLAQASSGELFLNFAASVYPWDSYIFSRSSTNSGTSWGAAVRVGYEPSRTLYGNAAVLAYNPFPVVANSGAVRLFWDMEATSIYPGSYAAQLFRKDLPSGPITQMSVTKEQMAKCGPCVPTGAFVADPINATTGNFTLPETDIAIPGKGLGLSFTRTFNAQRSTVDGPLGFGWTHDYDEKLTAYSRGEVLIIDGSGRNDLYTPKVGGGFDPPPGRFDTLVANVDGTYALTDTGFTKKTYSADGNLSAITDRNNNTLTLGYTSGKLTHGD